MYYTQAYKVSYQSWLETSASAAPHEASPKLTMNHSFLRSTDRLVVIVKSTQGSKGELLARFFGVKVEHKLELWSSLGAVWVDDALGNATPFAGDDFKSLLAILGVPAFDKPASGSVSDNQFSVSTGASAPDNHAGSTDAPTAVNGCDAVSFFVVAQNSHDTIHIVHTLRQRPFMNIVRTDERSLSRLVLTCLGSGTDGIRFPVYHACVGQ